MLMKSIGDVISVSTDKPMSAKSHSITTTPTLEATLLAEAPGYKEYVCNGTPVDCVKMGYQCLLDHKPDLVVSGINHGSNASTNVIYSGTMGAALEACMDGINSIGFSLDSHDPEAYLDHLNDHILAISKQVLAEGLPPDVCLNVNFPAWNGKPFNGVKVCRQAKGKWVEVYSQSTDENGKPCLVMGGKFLFEDGGGDTDYEALNDYYASIVPTHYDLTAKHCLGQMRHFEHLFTKQI